jgi:DNA-binding response OmpR family regulator
MKALVVEDDPTIVEMVEDVLFSLDLGFDVATNQQDSKELLAGQEYDLVLLDFQIPAKANRGGADKQYGMNLLRDIQRLKKPNPPPVIMMTAHLAECLDISAELQRSGVREFVSKPFSSKGRTLSSVIQSVLESSRSSNKAFEGPMPNVASLVRETKVLETKPFQGGELVILPDRVTLCGQTVLSNSRSKQTARILEALNTKTQVGTWVAKSGPELANETGNASGQNSITCSIRGFRESAAELLRTQLGLICDKQDIIRSGGPGYRYNEWISVRDARRAEAEPEGQDGTPASRREQILALLREGGQLRSTSIASHLGCSLKTVKRELDALRQSGHIEFIGPSKTGTYQLVYR